MCIVCFAGFGQGWLGAVRNQCGCMGKCEALCHLSKSRKTLLLYNNVHAKVSARIRHDDEAKKVTIAYTANYQPLNRIIPMTRDKLFKKNFTKVLSESQKAVPLQPQNRKEVV